MHQIHGVFHANTECICALYNYLYTLISSNNDKRRRSRIVDAWMHRIGIIIKGVVAKFRENGHKQYIPMGRDKLNPCRAMCQGHS